MTKRDELIALGGVGVKVRELEWEDADEGMCTKWRACALGGHYELVALDGDGCGLAVNFHWGRPLSFWFIQGEPDEWGPTGPKMFPALDTAKAAAQADYEARILSALEAPAAGDGEPVAWQYELADGREWSNGKPGEYVRWHWRLSREKPNVPEGSIRNLTPLFTAPPADARMREALNALEAEFQDDAIYSPAFPGQKITRTQKKRDRANLVMNAVFVIRQAITAPGATTKSDGGVIAEMIDIASGNYDGHGETLDPWTADNRSTIDGWISRLRQPGPSDPSSTRSEVTVDTRPGVLSAIRSIYGIGFGTFAGVYQNDSIERAADKIVALLDQFEIRRK